MTALRNPRERHCSRREVGNLSLFCFRQPVLPPPLREDGRWVLRRNTTCYLSVNRRPRSTINRPEAFRASPLGFRSVDGFLTGAVLLYKKADPHDIGNYRPICLLSVIYKLFTRVILNRIEKVLDEGQPCEQAGFRKGFSTIDHIHTVSKLIELSREYKIPLCLTFIDLKKDFDSVETEAVVEALDNQGVPTQYIKVLRELYSSFTTRTSPFYKNIIIDVKRGSDRMTQFHPKYSQLPSRTQCESWNGTTWE
ncbi:hypothetical protein RB195_023045 [Necator americanus]|uniref:Reverse transcriptase domain-containing protein n=1 Tax=Necator americanus TaxID=51031 RepID=A0ABR1EII9_NECAM